MQKYTVKELTQIEGDHDPLNCEEPSCPVCKAFYAYAMKLRTQTEIMERVDNRQKVAAIATDLCLSENFIQETVAACTGGITISAYQLKGYQAMLTTLVNSGLSISAIARHLRKPASTIRGYFNANDIPKPDSRKITFEVVTTANGDKRYFDRQGKEYRFEKVRQKRITSDALDLMTV